MSSELDDVARSLFIGQIPNIWRKLAPDTLKSLGNWMLYFLQRFSQYTSWVRERSLARGAAWTPCDHLPTVPHPQTSVSSWPSALEMVSDSPSVSVFFPFLVLRLGSGPLAAWFTGLRVCLGNCPSKSL